MLRQDLSRNVIRIEHHKSNANLPKIFSHDIGYAPNEGIVRFFYHLDHQVVYAYVPSSCWLLEEYEW